MIINRLQLVFIVELSEKKSESSRVQAFFAMTFLTKASIFSFLAVEILFAFTLVIFALKRLDSLPYKIGVTFNSVGIAFR